MPSVSVLYITDELVSTHLELLRNICEPTSKAKPHVTVRYFDKLRIPESHLHTTVDHIDLVSPGSFGLSKDDNQSNKTVYIRCHSDELLHLEHKPLFPTSEFHITIYDGFSEKLAKKLYSALKSFDWNFRVNLPLNTHLTAIQLKSKSRKLKPVIVEREYPNPKLKELLDKDPSANEELFNILKQAALNTLFEYTRMHAGGLNKIEPNELREVRLINLAEKFRNTAITSLL